MKPDRKTYEINIAGLMRELPIVQVTDNMCIASFVLLGDSQLVIKAAAALKPLVDSDQKKYGGAAPADAFQRISLKEGGTALLLPRFSGRGYLVEEKKEPEK